MRMQAVLLTPPKMAARSGLEDDRTVNRQEQSGMGCFWLKSQTDRQRQHGSVIKPRLEFVRGG